MNGDIDLNGDVDVASRPGERRRSLPPVSALALLPGAVIDGSEITKPAGAESHARASSDRGEAVKRGAAAALPAASPAPPFARREDELAAAREARLVAALDLDSTVDLVEQLSAITSELARTAKQPRPFPVRPSK